MNIVEFKIGGKYEEERIKSLQHINANAEDIMQDNQDLLYLQERYENLEISEHARAVIDDYIFCIRSREERMESLIYYSGVVDAGKF